MTFNADLDLETGVEYSFRAYAIGENGNKIYGAVKTVTVGDSPRDVDWTNGESPNVFTVASGRTVRFSQGNLQYHCSSDKEWRFAEHQFDMIHTENVNVSDEYTENSGKWIDMFGWGTSGVTGYTQIANCVAPWSTSTSNGDYYAYGEIGNNLYDGIGDNKGKADWGYNAIKAGDATTTGWRTLTKEEWGYLLDTRKDASERLLYGQGKVGNCTPGLIILPDNWNWNATALDGMRKPDGTGDLKFTLGGSAWLNTYSYSDWSKMESLGAVFLPAAGHRSGETLENVGDDGMYWSSSCSGSQACHSRFSFLAWVTPNEKSDRYYGYSVRLVKDVTSK